MDMITSICDKQRISKLDQPTSSSTYQRTLFTSDCAFVSIALGDTFWCPAEPISLGPSLAREMAARASAASLERKMAARDG